VLLKILSAGLGKAIQRWKSVIKVQRRSGWLFSDVRDPHHCISGTLFFPVRRGSLFGGLPMAVISACSPLHRFINAVPSWPAGY